MNAAESATTSLHTALDVACHSARDLAKAAQILMPGYVYDADAFIKMDEDKRIAMDALFLRYILVVAVFQDRLFKSIAVVEQEDPGPSRRDLSGLMEKLGVIGDAESFNTRVIARNTMAHTYIVEIDEQVDRLNTSLRYAVEFVRDFNTSLDYVVRKQLLPIHPLTGLKPVTLELPRNPRSSSRT